MFNKIKLSPIDFCLTTNRKINLLSPTFIIAEIGINHEGKFNLANTLVDKAFKAGADAVKFQIVNPDHSYSKNTKSYEIFKHSILSESSYKKLIKKYESRGLIFATPGDLDSLKLCEKLKFKLYKISSGLLSNIPLLEAIKKTNKSIILSTGMAYDKEVSKIIKIIMNKNRNNISVLHAVSLYPAPILKINLNSIKFIEKKYKVISGYSDHCTGWEACKIAVALGAKVIEKHFTLDNTRHGFDHGISLNPKDFKQMVKEIRFIEKIKGDFNKKPICEELKLKNSIVRYCVASKEILKGDIININNVHFKRINKISNGIKAFDFKKIREKKSNKNYKKNDILVY
ncbi:MAG: hypothetical protein CBC22_03700 [Alphaproteobacteria bacterium TMED62]|nr:MAG: hypothetical protein CBC22_03700 [Alphaproteobacteria bacterium TMED62]